MTKKLPHSKQDFSLNFVMKIFCQKEEKASFSFRQNYLKIEGGDAKCQNQIILQTNQASS